MLTGTVVGCSFSPIIGSRVCWDLGFCPPVDSFIPSSKVFLSLLPLFYCLWQVYVKAIIIPTQFSCFRLTLSIGSIEATLGASWRPWNWLLFLQQGKLEVVDFFCLGCQNNLASFGTIILNLCKQEKQQEKLLFCLRWQNILGFIWMRKRALKCINNKKRIPSEI